MGLIGLTMAFYGDLQGILTALTTSTDHILIPYWGPCFLEIPIYHLLYIIYSLSYTVYYILYIISSIPHIFYTIYSIPYILYHI